MAFLPGGKVVISHVSLASSASNSTFMALTQFIFWTACLKEVGSVFAVKVVKKHAKEGATCYVETVTRFVLVETFEFVEQK